MAHRLSSSDDDHLCVFLDQNHWIALTRAFHGHPEGAVHREVLDRLLAAVARDACRVPLSLSHFIEHSRINDANRRRHLAEMYEAVSRNWFFADLHDVVNEEFPRAAAETFNTGLIFPRPEVFGRGVYFALGSSGRSHMMTDTSSAAIRVFADATRQSGAILALATTQIEENRRRLNRNIRAKATADVAAAESVRLARQPHSQELWRRAEAARYAFDFQDRIGRAAVANGYKFEDLMSLGHEEATKFFTRVPTLHTNSELTLYRDRQWSRKVQVNDVNDFWYLLLAIPYCDVVVTEHFWCRAAREQRLGEKFGTTIISDLKELTGLLPQ